MRAAKNCVTHDRNVQMPTHLALELTGAAAGVTIALLLLFLAAVRHYSDPS